VEKKQSDLCLEILRRFHNAGILDDLILIGSWCVYFYKDYFDRLFENLLILWQYHGRQPRRSELVKTPSQKVTAQSQKKR